MHAWPYAAYNCMLGAVRGSKGHPAADDDLASEKGHFFHDYRGGGELPPAPPPRHSPDMVGLQQWRQSKGAGGQSPHPLFPTPKRSEVFKNLEEFDFLSIKIIVNFFDFLPVRNTKSLIFSSQKCEKSDF